MLELEYYIYKYINSHESFVQFSRWLPPHTSGEHKKKNMKYANIVSRLDEGGFILA